MEQKLAALMAVENELLGQHYNLAGVIELGGIEILRHFGDSPDRVPVDPKQEAFCSETATRFLEELPIPDAAVPAVTDPQQVIDYLTAIAAA